MKLSRTQIQYLNDLGISVWRSRGDEGASVQTERVYARAQIQPPYDPESPDLVEGGSTNPAAQALAAIAQPSDEFVREEPYSVGSRDDRVADAIDAPAAAVVAQPIAFDWTRMGHAVLLHEPIHDPALNQFCRDLLLAVNWIVVAKEAPNTGKVSRGEFRWPQLENSSGSPERVLAAWWDKHVVQPATVIAQTGVIEQLQAWHAFDKNVVQEIQALDQMMGQPELKRVLWQQLHP
ncbi:MAG: hypothetical protein AAF541_02650 [Pseudomonadota bacterium]